MGVKAFTPAEIQKAYDQSREMRVGSDYTFNKYSLKVGKQTPERNVIRIMPPHEDQKDLFVRLRTHFGLGPSIGTPWEMIPRDARRTAAPCPEMFGDPCVLCEYSQEVFNKARAATNETARVHAENLSRALKPKERFAVLVLDMLNPGPSVLEFWFGIDLYRRLIACFKDDLGKERDITDPQGGRNILIEASKKAGTNWDQYDQVRAFDNVEALTDWPRWEPQIYNLEALHVYQPTKEQLWEAFKTGNRIQRAGPVHQAAFPPGFTPALSGAEAAKVVGSGRVAPPDVPSQIPLPAGGTPPVARRAPGPAKRKAPAEKPAAASADPWMRGRHWLASQGEGQGFTTFTVLQEMTPEQFETVKANGELDDVPCFTTADPKAESICRGCKVLLVCATHKVAAA